MLLMVPAVCPERCWMETPELFKSCTDAPAAERRMIKGVRKAFSSASHRLQHKEEGRAA